MVGRDNIVLSASTGSDLAAHPALGQVGKLKVVYEAGTFLGMVSDFDVDPSDCRLTTMPVHADGVRGLGATTTVVAAEPCGAGS